MAKPFALTNPEFSIEKAVTKWRNVYLAFIMRTAHCNFETAEDIFFTYVAYLFERGITHACPAYIKSGLKNKCIDHVRRDSKVDSYSLQDILIHNGEQLKKLLFEEKFVDSGATVPLNDVEFQTGFLDKLTPDLLKTATALIEKDGASIEKSRRFRNKNKLIALMDNYNKEQGTTHETKNNP